MVETFIIYTPQRQVKGRNRTKENNLDTYKGNEAKGNGAIQKIKGPCDWSTMSMGKTIAGEAGGKGQITKCPLYHVKDFEYILKHPDMALEKF